MSRFVKTGDAVDEEWRAEEEEEGKSNCDKFNNVFTSTRNIKQI